MEGHTVCFGDHASLVSTDFEAEYVHVSRGFIKTEVGIVHEVNLSSSAETAWSLECFFPHNMQSASHVKAGDVVRLHHPYSDAYVASTMDDDTVCLQRSDGSLSSTMWVVSEDNVLVGGLLRSKHSYKFQQLVTRKHMVPSGKLLLPALTLTSEGQSIDDDFDESGLFSAVEASVHGGHAALITLQPIDCDEKSEHVKWGSR